MNKLIKGGLLVFITIISGAFASCSGDDDHKPFEKGGAVPDVVTNVTIKSTAGGADISYTLPSNPDLMYIQAEIHTPEGTIKKYSASSYNASISIVGLASTGIHEVDIYSVNKSGIMSAPVKENFSPLEPPYISMIKSMEYNATFGGVYLEYANPTKASTALSLGLVNSKGEFVDEKTIYTKDEVVKQSFRGYESTSTKFWISIRDQWDNFSDTIVFEATPLFEQELDKSKFNGYVLPGDGPYYGINGNPAPGRPDLLNWETLWDNLWVIETTNSSPQTKVNYKNWETLPYVSQTDPTVMAIDLGVKAQLSRARFDHYYVYNTHAPRIYQVWGCSDEPAADGSWDNWILLADVENKKPSGLGSGQYSSEDFLAWVQGDDIDFPVDAPEIRYIRIKCLENWRGFGNFSLCETTFYGAMPQP